MYEEEIENDIATLKGLGISSNRWEEIERELQTRLKGQDTEDKGDDQLLGEAAKLSTTEWRARLGQ